MNKYKGKYFSILGDSITTFEGVSEPKEGVFYDTSKKIASGVTTADKTWWGIVLKELGGKLLVNNSISGSTVTGNSLFDYQSYGCSDLRTSSLGADGVNPDIIIVYLGTNDWGKGIKIRVENSSDFEESNIFSNSYAIMLEKIKRNYPDAEVWCFTLATSFCSAVDSYEFPYYYNGIHILEYCESIRQNAKKYGCRLIELFSDIKPFDTFDGAHPNVDGMRTLADNILANLSHRD